MNFPKPLPRISLDSDLFDILPKRNLEEFTESSSEDESIGEDELSFEESSISSESTSSLESLANFISNTLKPLGGKYSVYATSYITSVIPSSPLHSDETASFTGFPPPFKNPVKEKKFEVQEKRRKELGLSSHAGKLIPSSKHVLEDLRTKVMKIPDEKKTAFLLEKGKQWCEVNKALAVDKKYPKISPNILRQKYSEEFQKALKQARKQARLSDKKGIFQKHLVGESSIRFEENEARQEKLKDEILAILGEPNKQQVLSTPEQSWQLSARKTANIKPMPKKKPPFRRTEYPPKSKDEKIAELRKRLPPPKQKGLETDYLSGIWEAGLEDEDFTITPFNYDSRVIHKDRSDYKEKYDGTGKSPLVEWNVLQEARDKCKTWLASIPD